MNNASQLFEELTNQLEDLFGLAVEGRLSDQPSEVLHALAHAVATGMHNASRTVLLIRLSLPEV